VTPAAQVNETDGRTGASGTLTFVYALSSQLIKLSPNNGNPFVPLCAGAVELTTDASGNVKVVPCTPGEVGHAGSGGQPNSGWYGDKLNPDGTFSGSQTWSICGDDNVWWNILGTYQDPIDATQNPTVTAWQGGSKFRYFTISVPWPWDIKWGG
jgi:hypothetical protein